jgi:hypothetical protein
MRKTKGKYVQNAGRENLGVSAAMQSVMPNTDPIGKESTKPQVTSEKYKGTNEQGISGTYIKSTTTIPGSGGGTGSGTINRTPEGDKAYAALTAEQRAAQDAKWRAMNPTTPDQTNTQIRFNPDSQTLTMQPIKPLKTQVPKAPGIKPLAKPVPTIQAVRGTADDPANTQRGLSGTTSSGGSSSTSERIISPKNLQNVISGIQSGSNQIATKYNPDNVPSRVQGAGPEAVSKWQEKVKSRKQNLTPQFKVNYK